MGFYDEISSSRLDTLLCDDEVDFVVACVQDEVVGYAFCLPQERGALLDQIAVAPSYRGSGVASELLAALEESTVSRTSRLVAEIISDNQRSKRFFAKHGFTRETVCSGPESGLSWEVWAKMLVS